MGDPMSTDCGGEEAEKGLSFWQAPSITAIGKFNNLTEEGANTMNTAKSSKRREIQLPFCCPEEEFEYHCGF